MEVIVAGASWLLGSLNANGLVPSNWQIPFLAQPTDRYGILKDLSPRLSSAAAIYMPGSDGFASATARWKPLQEGPGYFSVVEVATEEDVQVTIKFANQHNLPFYAQASGHSMWGGLAELKNGIQINLRKLDSVEIDRVGGEKARLGGGVLVKKLVDDLAKAGKYAVAGTCECVAASGATFGGGHGFLQGHYGLASDNMVSARVVLANGTAVTASETEHSDLFWGLRGAGANFGIITSWEHRVYDIPPDDSWSVTAMIFKQDKLEQLMELYNALTEDESRHPPELLAWGAFARVPPIDAEHPVIIVTIMYQGPAGSETPFTKPFADLNPVSTTAQHVPYDQLSVANGFDLNSNPCQHTYNSVLFGISLMRYNVTAQRRAFEIFSEFTAHQPFSGSAFMLEGYGTKAVRAIDEKNSAVPREEREKNFILGLLLMWPRDTDPKLEEHARVAGEKMRAAYNEGRDRRDDWPPHTYVNYGRGNEPLEEMYGHDSWRLEKLRRLKKIYDPENKLRHFAPIV